MTEPSRPLRVAVADDELDTREFLRDLLTRLGHEVVAVAATGQELVEQCRATAPDLIIADISLPVLDGIAAAVEINRDRDVPVLLVAGPREAEVLEPAVVDHVMAYLLKPVSPVQVGVAVRVALLRFGRFLEVRQEAAARPQALADRKLVERAKAAVMSRLGVTEEEAYRRLRQYADDHNLRLVDLARRLLTTDETFRQLEAPEGGRSS